mgnify:CR=1 FL=1
MESGENKNFMFSIIIPHKNTPDLLERCVNSIPKRDDLEIIIIDDNSSPEIVNFENFPFKNDDSRNLKIIFVKILSLPAPKSCAASIIFTSSFESEEYIGKII